MEIILHPRTSAALDVLRRRPAGSYLFHGPRSVGKATAALETARRLICDNTANDTNRSCPACRQFAAGTYPDLEVLKPETKTSIIIEQVRILIEHFSRRPYYQGKTRIAIVDDADRLTIDAANALLKIIEEPPDQTIFLLIAEQPEALLATIRSRCTAVYFIPPPIPDLAAYLSRRFNLTPLAAAGLAAATVTPGLAVTTATDPEATAAHAHLTEAAASALTASRFNRLLLAARLAASADLLKFARALHIRLTADLLGGADESLSSRRLQALEKFRRHQAAGVTPKVALEKLMLEL